MAKDDEGNTGPARRERLFAGMEGDTHHSGRTLSAVLLCIAVFLLTGFLSAWQVSREEHASKALAAGIAATTDVDALLRQNLGPLRAQAAANPDAVLTLPEFPLDVYLAGDEVETLEEAELRAVILARGAAIVYREGLGAFDRTGKQDYSLFSLQGAADQVLDQLNAGAHDRYGTFTVVLALATAVLAAWVVASHSGSPYRGIRLLGSAAVAGALPGFALTAIVKLWLDGAGGDAYTADLKAILGDLMSVPRRNYAIVAGAGLLVALAGPVFRLLAIEVAALGRGKAQEGTTAGQEDHA